MTLADRLEAWSGFLDGEIYLVLDQLEEYLLYHGADGGGPLAAALSEIVTRPSLRVDVLVGIRDDALSQLDVFKSRVPQLFGNMLRLDHLTRDEGRKAIVGPLGELSGLGSPPVTAEPELVESVLDDVSAGRIAVTEGRGVLPDSTANGRIEAPYLQLVMERLWDVETSRGSDVLRAATLTELGGAAHIVAEHLERALASLDPAGQDLAARVFGFLVTPSGTKIAHRAGDLARYAGVSEEELRPVLDRLASERVLRPVPDGHGGPPRYEIFHDVLSDAVLGWGVRHEAERELEQARLQARLRHRRLGVVASAAVFGLAVMTALTVWALVERDNAQQTALEAKARELEARAVTLLPTDPELAMALAAESARTSPVATAEDVLRQTLMANHLLQVLPAHGPVVDVAFEPLDQIWTGSADGRARYYQSRPFRLVLETRHRAPVTRVIPAFVGMASASLDGTARISVTPDMADLGEKPHVLRHAQPVMALAQSMRCRGGAPCLVTGAGRIVSTWDQRSGRRFAAIRLPAVIGEIAVLPSGRAAVRAADEIVRIVDLKRGGVVERLDAGARVDSIGVHPEREIVAAGLADGRVVVWNAATAKTVGRFEPHLGPVLDLDLAADRLLTGSADGTATVRDLTTGRAVPLPGGHGNLVRAVELSRDGRFALTASADGTAKVWETEGGRLVSVLAGHTDAVVDAAFSADALRVVTGSLDGTARVWSSGARPELQVSGAEPPARPARVATAPDGARAVVVRNTVRIRTATGETRILRGHRDTVNSVAFNSDGSLVVTASRDHDARIWDARTGALVHQLEGHFGSVADARFSPDGRWVVTAGPITAGLWNVRTGDLVGYLRGPKTRLRAAGFANDSRTITIVEADGTTMTHDCVLCATAADLLVLADARMRATGRTLTPEERARYLG